MDLSKSLRLYRVLGIIVRFQYLVKGLTLKRSCQIMTQKKSAVFYILTNILLLFLLKFNTSCLPCFLRKKTKQTSKQKNMFSRYNLWPVFSIFILNPIVHTGKLSIKVFSKLKCDKIDLHKYCIIFSGKSISSVSSYQSTNWRQGRELKLWSVLNVSF